jgi:predicted nucleotide-binding protein (sugar kinase/HSP70/actin superfamily)
MGKSKLPKDIAVLLRARGLAGQRVYVPADDRHSLVSEHVPRLLLEIEADYERRGVTFSTEASPRKMFSKVFGKSLVAHRFNLKVRTAARVASAAWRAWREWFSRQERPRLEQLRALAQETGREYQSLYFSYIEIRGELRSGKAVVVEFYARFHSIPATAIERMIEIAGASIASCPWRVSGNIS